MDWKKTTAISAPGTLNANLASVTGTTSSDASTTIASINTLDLSVYATEVRNIGTNIGTSVTSTIDVQSNSVITNVKTQLINVNTSVADTLLPVQNNLFSTIDGVIVQINQLFTTAKTYDNYRYDLS